MRRLLVLYWYPPSQPMRLAVAQHLRSLERQGLRIVYHNAFKPVPRWVRMVSFDGVVLSTTFLGIRWYADFAKYHRAYRWLTELDCPKIALPQDEYDHAARLDAWLDELGASHVFSIFDDHARAGLYPSVSTKATFRRALTGYIDRAAAARVALQLRPHSERATDIVYRATQLPYWFGSHGQLKHRVGEVTSLRATAHGLRADISTRWDDTIYGEQWLEFIASGRSTVGAESGSSALDHRGEVRKRIEALLEKAPNLTFEQVDAAMPAGWDDYKFYALSPRHLEAVITKTCQVLVEGSYSGVLEAGRHYLPIRRDFTDLDEALERLLDPEVTERLAEQAYEEIHMSGRYSYEEFATQILDAIVPEVAHDRGGLSDVVVAVATGGRLLRRVAVQQASTLVQAMPSGRLRASAQRLRDAYRVARAPTNALTMTSLIRRRLGQLLTDSRAWAGSRRDGTR